MSTRPKLMSRIKGKSVELGYLFPDQPATIYLGPEGKGGRYDYANEGQLASEGWSEHLADVADSSQDAPQD